MCFDPNPAIEENPQRIPMSRRVTQRSIDEDVQFERDRVFRDHSYVVAPFLKICEAFEGTLTAGLLQDHAEMI